MRRSKTIITNLIQTPKSYLAHSDPIPLNLTTTHRFPHPSPLTHNPHTPMSTLKQSLKSQKLTPKKPQTSQIVSLLAEELEQLSKLEHYQKSVALLEKNQIQGACRYLEFALTEAKAKFGESVNLYMFLLNRISILQKIIGQDGKFTDTLEEIFFMCLSLKGDKSLDTLKCLSNYMIALILNNPQKLPILIEYLQQQNFKTLLKKSQYLTAISKYLNNSHQQGLNQIEQNLGSTQNQTENQLKYLKLNNLNWFKLLELTKGTFQLVGAGAGVGRGQGQGEGEGRLKQGKEQLLREVEGMLKGFIRALIESQNHGESVMDDKELQKNLLMIAILTQYLQKGDITLLQKIPPTTLLSNPQSPIIAMNISHTLYLLAHHPQSLTFSTLTLQSSIQQQQPYRVGLVLLLMARINYKLKLEWQGILLNVLENRGRYSLAVRGECLRLYGRFLVGGGRFYEAEGYLLQGEGVGRVEVQGLVLPDFDFQF